MSKLANGFYWVKRRGWTRATVAEWNGSFWRYIGTLSKNTTLDGEVLSPCFRLGDLNGSYRVIDGALVAQPSDA